MSAACISVSVLSSGWRIPFCSAFIWRPQRPQAGVFAIRGWCWRIHSRRPGRRVQVRCQGVVIGPINCPSFALPVLFYPCCIITCGPSFCLGFQPLNGLSNWRADNKCSSSRKGRLRSAQQGQETHTAAPRKNASLSHLPLQLGRLSDITEKVATRALFFAHTGHVQITMRRSMVPDDV